MVLLNFAAELKKITDRNAKPKKKFAEKLNDIMKGPMSVADVIRSYNGMSMNAKMNMDRDLGTNFIQYLNAEGNLGWTDYKREMRKFYAGGNMVRRWMKKYGVDDASGPLAFGTVVSRKKEMIDWVATWRAVPENKRKEILFSILHKHLQRTRGADFDMDSFMMSYGFMIEDHRWFNDNMHDLDFMADEIGLNREIGDKWRYDLMDAIRSYAVESRPW